MAKKADSAVNTAPVVQAERLHENDMINHSMQISQMLKEKRKAETAERLVRKNKKLTQQLRRMQTVANTKNV